MAIRSPNSIRSGRFSSSTAMTTPLIIIQGRSGAFYRILNSGRNPITVNAGGSTTQLGMTLSLDVTVSGRIQISSATDVPIEGIYEYLNTERPIRSGRFKVTLGTGVRHKIIDLTRSGTSPVHPEAYYRILNAGSVPFFVQLGPATGPKKEIAAGQSYDFEVPTGARDIYVLPVTDGTEIDGIYDFLGQQ